MGNWRSVMGAVERLGHRATLTRDRTELATVDKPILPGVGAFGEAMRNLHELGLVDLLHRIVREEGKPILGICLGFQLMAEESLEFGHHRGLGWINGSVAKLNTATGLPLPHIGWNDLFQVQESRLLRGVPEGALFYYVHSFHVACREVGMVTGECGYGDRFVASVEAGNIFGTQFHPEKSQQWGLRVLRNFLEIR